MEALLQKVYMVQKDKGVKNRGSFSSPDSPSSVSWRAVTCVEPRDRFGSVPATELGRGAMSQKTQFVDLADARPGRGGTIPCSCVSTHPKTTSARNVIHKEGTANSLSPPPASPRFCYHGMHTLKHWYLASSFQAERSAATSSFLPILTRQVSS